MSIDDANQVPTSTTVDLDRLTKQYTLLGGRVESLRSMGAIEPRTSASEPCMKLSPHTAPKYLFGSSVIVGGNFGV
ncbi:hypothetical protein, partial [Moorena sp. SIO3I6]|uniref:hypothetical protein n=1 Tax=Moorena sp. SIO3I6 TaxID=2607831 RepID=UPI0013F742AD